MRLSYLLNILCITITQSLQITNITSSVALTSIFYNDSSQTSLIEFNIGFMSYYIDPKDTSQTKHLWLGIFQTINDSKMGEIHTSINSDIFNSNFIQYNPSNNNITNLLPITLSHSSDQINNTNNTDDVSLNFMCTSPKTHDIITCWLIYTSFLTPMQRKYVSNIQCKIFFVATNTFSDVINITAPYNHPDAEQEFNVPGSIVCFHDSYWIPYMDLAYPTETPYHALIDLNGNIIFDQSPLSLNYSLTDPTFTLSLTKNVYQNGTKSYETFIIVYENYNVFTNISNISGAYGYYTDIHDSSPIHIIEDHSINHQYTKPIYKGPDTMELADSPLSINFTENCCYISMYSYDHPDQQSNAYRQDNAYEDIYGIFTDNNGNPLNISSQAYFEDILLIKNAYGVFPNYAYNGVIPFIVDLPMISTDSSCYFMVTFGNSTQQNRDGSDIIMAQVFYLTYDSTESVYDLHNAEIFSTVQLVNQQSLYNHIDSYSVYIMPGTNELFYSWTEYTENSYLVYGQTWAIN